jgi:hypothetical protein
MSRLNEKPGLGTDSTIQYLDDQLEREKRQSLNWFAQQDINQEEFNRLLDRMGYSSEGIPVNPFITQTGPAGLIAGESTPGFDAMSKARQDLNEQLTYLENIRKMVEERAIESGYSPEYAQKTAVTAAPVTTSEQARDNTGNLDPRKYTDITGTDPAGIPGDLIEGTYTDPDGTMWGYDMLGRKWVISRPTTPTPTPTKQQGFDIVDTTQDIINKVGTAAGTVADTIYDVFGIPVPDFTVLNPRSGTATATWGTPSGSVFGKVGTSPGGTTYGVLTGIPVLDQVITSTMDVVTGRANAGDAVSKDDVYGVLMEQARDVLGLPSGQATGKEVVEQIRKVIEEGKSKPKTSISLDGGPTTDKTPNGGNLNTTTTTDTTDKTPNGGNLNTTTTTDTTDKTPYLDLNTATTTDETPETPETPTGGEGDGGEGGAGYTQGIGVHSGAPGDVVDLDYLYDISGRSIFAPRTEDETENDSRPYVYAKSGGMIHNNYDLTDEILRRLIRGR